MLSSPLLPVSNTGQVSLNDWATAVESVLRLGLPWRMLRFQLATCKTPGGMLDYQEWFQELSIKEPQMEVMACYVCHLTSILMILIKSLWMYILLSQQVNCVCLSCPSIHGYIAFCGNTAVCHDTPLISKSDAIENNWCSQTTLPLIAYAAHRSGFAGDPVPPSRHLGDHLQNSGFRQLR